MASFGSFETEREVYSGATYSVYNAKKQGDSKTEYAIKVFSAHHITLEPEAAEQLDPLLSDIERACVDRIAVQQKAAATSKFIAPILENGRDERGVWYATKFYPRSVNKIISGHVALNRESLQHIILSIAQGALDIKRACGRSHGEILPSNVQISRSEKLTKADVVLSDPMPGDEAEAARYELSDLRSIGRILLQLVQRREINHEEDFLILPILVAPEWTELFEKDTDAWLELVNKLLDPNLSLEGLTLEQLVAKLQKLQPETGISPKVLIAAAAGVLVLGVGVFLLMPRRTQTVEITSDPSGATLLVDKQEQDGKTPMKLKLKKGANYTIEARQDNLRLLEQTTNWVVQGGGSAKVHFRFPYGSVSIQSVPSGATITSNGVVIGTTPKEIPVVAEGAELKYELSKVEYAAMKIQGRVTNGQPLILKGSLLLLKDVESVDLDSKPRGASVYWDNQLLTSATPEPVSLKPGTYKLTARYKENEGWPVKELTMEVKKGASNSVEFYFENGRVAVDSDPSGASFWIGTNLIGTTPMTITRPAGKTTFHFERAGFEPTNETVLVADKAIAHTKASLLSNNGEFDLTAEPAVAVAQIFDGTGKELGRTSEGNPFKTNLPPGQYSFLARIDGLIDVPATLQVQKREIRNYTFKFDAGTVRLESEPPGATISINGKQIGATPKTLVQKPDATVSYEVAALNYTPIVKEVRLKNHEYDNRVMLSLARRPADVVLESDPRGAEFFTEGGVALKPNGEYYNIPWGPTNLVARHRRLGARTNAFDIQPGTVNKFDPVKFIYGTLMLTNLEGLTIKEGTEEVQSAASPMTASYELPGPHTYDLYDGSQKVDSLRTNIEAGLTFVWNSLVAGDKRNSIGMRLVKVRNFLGQGRDAYVGKNEVTQKEYKAVMGDNPSAHPAGDDYPVENVTWINATNFCDKLTRMDTSPPTAAGRYWLPTLEQWTIFGPGTALTTNTAVYGGSNTARVGSKAANSKGLNDVLGNVSEWLAGNDSRDKDYVGGYFKSRPAFGGMGVFTNTQQLQLDQAYPYIGFRVIWLPGK